MITIDEISRMIIWLLRFGVAFRFVFCCFRMIGNEEDGASFKKRAKNVMMFYILAESIWQIKNLVMSYYGD